MTLDRRRYARHKISTPAYASVAGSSGGAITDANERGILLQTVNPLPLFNFVDIRLDLLETRSTVATSARVVWSDVAGRAGIEFVSLSAEAHRQLKQWLLVNALAAIDSARAAEVLGAPPSPNIQSSEQASTIPLLPGNATFAQEGHLDAQTNNEQRSALNKSEARIRAAQKNVTQRNPAHAKEVSLSGGLISDPNMNVALEAAGAAIEQELRSAVQHAQAITGADGAAIALSQAAEVVCRASAGDIAPPLGSQLHTDAGISGACLRSGRTLQCQNAELDLYVDRESCRALGISSVLAVPIVAENVPQNAASNSISLQSGVRSRVVGIVEVFSRRTYAFDRNHCTALEGLARSISKLIETEYQSRSRAAEDLEKVPSAPIPQSQVPQSQNVSPESTTTNTNSAVQIRQGGTPGSGAVPQPPTKLSSSPITNDAAVREPDEAAGRELSAEASKRVLFLAVLGGLIVAGLFFSFVNPLNWSKAASASSSVTEDSEGVGGGSAPDTSAPSESMQELRKKAEQGIPAAQFALGAKYANGEDLTQNYPVAVKWFSKAAEQGHVLAAATLGAYYWAGRGVPPDYVNAYMWSAIAKAGGDEASKYRVAILSSRMSPAEVAEGQSRAAAWLRDHPKQISQNDRHPASP